MNKKRLFTGFPLLLLATTTLQLPSSAQTQGCIVGWGVDNGGILSNIPPGSDFVEVHSTGATGIARRSDGSLVAWGGNPDGMISNLPTGNDFIGLDAASFSAIAIREDGSLAAWGWDVHGAVSGTPAGTGFLDAAITGYNGAAINADGSLVCWGTDNEGAVTNTPAGTGFVRVHGSDGGGNFIAERADGSIVTWGFDGFSLVTDAPADTGIQSIGMGERHATILLEDGSLFSWGNPFHNIVPDTPAGNDFTQVSAFRYSGLALRSNGTLAAWGSDNFGEVSDLPTDDGYFFLGAGFGTGLALRCESGTVGQPFGFCTSGPCGAVDLEAGCPNSTGLGATLLGSGSPSVAADDLELSMRRLPANVSVILFKGPLVRDTPLLFGDGLRWVGGALNRYPIATTNSGGELTVGSISSHSVNFPSTGLVTAGSTWYFQGWYRDRSGPCNGQFNLTHGLQVDFTP